MDAALQTFAKRLDAVVATSTGADHVGSYVHGSVVLGGFVAHRSDVDALFVVRDGHSFDAARVAADLVEAAHPCPGRGIEVSVVTSSAAVHPAPPWPFVLHVSTEPIDARTVLGATHSGDPDLLMHYAMARAGGVPISGPPTAEVFGPVEHDAIVRYLRDELADALDSAPRAYVVLNACRAWQFVETGALVSKVAGAAWAMGRTRDDALIRSALDEQTGRAKPAPIDARTRAFVGVVVRQLRA